MNAQVTYRGRGERGSVNWAKHDAPGDLELIEGLTRHALAGVVGRTLGPTQDVIVNGVPVSDAMITPGGVVMVGLLPWAQAHEVTVNQNGRRGSFSFTHDGVAFVGAISAKSLKRGSQWSALPAAVLRYEDRSYVPLVRFEELVG